MLLVVGVLRLVIVIFCCGKLRLILPKMMVVVVRALRVMVGRLRLFGRIVCRLLVGVFLLRLRMVLRAVPRIPIVIRLLLCCRLLIPSGILIRVIFLICRLTRSCRGVLWVVVFRLILLLSSLVRRLSIPRIVTRSLLFVRF